MANHRADHRGSRRGPSGTRQEKPAAPYAGRRVAGRSVPTITAVEPVLHVTEPVVVPEPVVARAEATTSFHADATERLPLVSAPGKRKAVKHAGNRGPLFRGLPSAPVLVGIAALAVSAGGAVLVSGPTLPGAEAPRLSQASALSGASGAAEVSPLAAKRRQVISRDTRRDALETQQDQELLETTEQLADVRTGTLTQYAQRAEKFAAFKAKNQWVLPLSGYRLTATFGQYGLWSSYHTGLDFAAPTGTPINAVANGVVTETGYDGAYGNKTVVTLEDGTEMWYCHQTTIDVSVGDTVAAGDHLGTVGSTGNVTGPHLHLEVRPGAGDPVDPYSALAANGVTP